MDIFPFQVHGNPGSFPVSWEPLLTFHFFNGNLVLNQNPGYPERNYEEIGEKKMKVQFPCGTGERLY